MNGPELPMTERALRNDLSRPKEPKDREKGLRITHQSKRMQRMQRMRKRDPAPANRLGAGKSDAQLCRKSDERVRMLIPRCSNVDRSRPSPGRRAVWVTWDRVLARRGTIGSRKAQLHLNLCDFNVGNSRDWVCST